MSRNIIHTQQAPAPVGPYNQAVVANGLVFVAGQISIDPQTNEVVHREDVTKQTQQVMTNLEAILTAANCSWDHVVKTTIFLADLADFGAVNQVYAQYFNLETAPARACVEVSRLPKDVKVEIECVAIVPNAN